MIKERSFFRGKVTLVSGRESDFYFDMKPTMFSPDGAAALADMILDRLAPMDVDYIGGLAVGAVPLVSAAVAMSARGGRPIPGFFVRKEVKGHGTRKTIEGLPHGETLAGKRVVIFDDVTTTGGSAMNAVQEARSAGAKVVLVLSIVDREEGAVEFFHHADVPFEAFFKAGEFLAA
jgi:orotate phosphoribosyltransferase